MKFMKNVENSKNKFKKVLPPHLSKHTVNDVLLCLSICLYVHERGHSLLQTWDLFQIWPRLMLPTRPGMVHQVDTGTLGEKEIMIYVFLPVYQRCNIFYF